jgi:hypothetical protein
VIRAVCESRRERNGSRSTERLCEPRQHREVGVKLHALQSANAERQQSVVVLQVAKRTLNSGASAVEVAEPLAVARDAWEVPTADSNRKRYLLSANSTERDDRFAAAFLALGVDASKPLST